MAPRYVGRFAPSPTGPLHAGSLVAALASWLDARAHRGRWLVRIEDVDGPRCVPGADQEILRQLAACGLVPDDAPVWQSTRSEAYEAALARLRAPTIPARDRDDKAMVLNSMADGSYPQSLSPPARPGVVGGRTYPCGCSRCDIEQALAALGQTPERHGELVYPGTCRDGLHGKPARSWRFRVEPGITRWTDRRLGPQQQDVEREVGDFVLKRADGLWAYQLAVVVDDEWQGITDVVRGEDLADNTARQVQLQRALGFDTPRYLHTPLVMGANGEKLSKQNGAQALSVDDPVAALNDAARSLGLSHHAGGIAEALPAWVGQWAATYNRAGD